MAMGNRICSGGENDGQLTMSLMDRVSIGGSASCGQIPVRHSVVDGAIDFTSDGKSDMCSAAWTMARRHCGPGMAARSRSSSTFDRRSAEPCTTAEPRHSHVGINMQAATLLAHFGRLMIEPDYWMVNGRSYLIWRAAAGRVGTERFRRQTATVDKFLQMSFRFFKSDLRLA